MNGPPPTAIAADLRTIDEAQFGHAHITEISASARTLRSDLRELWAYRDLLGLLVRRDITIRYKQSIIGIAWAVVQPLLMMIIFTVIFGSFAKLPSEGYPYALFTLSALLPWLYFTKSLSGTSDSLVTSSGLISKVYFPRLIIPLSKSLNGLVDFAIGLVVMAFVLAWYRVMPGWGVILLPIMIVQAMLTALAVGLWLTALNVRYRDIALIVPFLAQIWMYASPIAYSTTIVPERWRWIYSLNPMVSVVEGFRWALLGKEPPDLAPALISLAVVALLFAGGLRFFRRTEQSLADII